MTAQQGEHARLPADHRILRPRPFLAGTIPQPTETNLDHDQRMDQLAARIAEQARAARQRERERQQQPRPRRRTTSGNR